MEYPQYYHTFSQLWKFNLAPLSALFDVEKVVLPTF